MEHPVFLQKSCHSSNHESYLAQIKTLLNYMFVSTKDCRSGSRFNMTFPLCLNLVFSFQNNDVQFPFELKNMKNPRQFCKNFVLAIKCYVYV